MHLIVSKFGNNIQMNMIVIKVGSQQDESCKDIMMSLFMY